MAQARTQERAAVDKQRAAYKRMMAPSKPHPSEADSGLTHIPVNPLSPCIPPSSPNVSPSICRYTP